MPNPSTPAAIRERTELDAQLSGADVVAQQQAEAAQKARARKSRSTTTADKDVTP